MDSLPNLIQTISLFVVTNFMEFEGKTTEGVLNFLAYN